MAINLTLTETNPTFTEGHGGGRTAPPNQTEITPTYVINPGPPIVRTDPATEVT